MSFDSDSDDGRRNAMIAVGVGGVALVMVGLMFWLMSSLPGPQLATTAVARPTTSATTAAPAAPASASASAPAVGTWTPSTTFSLPPPEQPTMTAPAAAATTDAPKTTAPPAPAPAPVPAPAPAPTPAPPAAPSVTNVKLTCSKGDGRKTTGTLSFTTTTKVNAALSAGGTVERKAGGPGDVSISASGRGAAVCFGQINDQVVGPIPAT